MKNKEHLKTVLLIGLVITNVFLGSKIFINKKLWPTGYNFFANTENYTFFKFFSKVVDKYQNISISKLHITNPNNIIINTGDQTTRFSLNQSHDKYKTVNDITKNILNEAFIVSPKNITPVSSDEWYLALTGKSVYLSYTTEFSTDLFTQFLGIKNSETGNSISNISNVVISANIPFAVYVQDKNTDTYYKIPLTGTQTNLEETIDYFQTKFDTSDANSSLIINYSFDLKFDQPFGEQTTTLEPMIPLYNSPQTTHIINSENPIFKNDVFNQASINKILKIFAVNPTSITRYTESNGTLVFVENDCVFLKLYTNGILEYTANENSSGLNLIDTAAPISSYNSICGLTDFMDKLNNAVSSEKSMYVSSPLSIENTTLPLIDVSFDYYMNGLPVSIDISTQKNAVNASIENGYLKKYIHVLRSYDNTNTTYETPIYIDVLDQIIEPYLNQMDTVPIDKMYVSYFDNGTHGEKTANWNVKIKQ